MSILAELRDVRALMCTGNKRLARILTEQLEKLQMRVEHLQDAAMLITRIQDAHDRGCPYEIVIMDQQLIERDFAVVIEELRALPPAQRPIRISLCLPTSGSTGSFRETNGETIIFLPVMPEELLDILARTWSRRKAYPTVPPEEAQSSGSAEGPIYGPNETAPESIDAHILLVADNPFNQQVARLLLERLGCRADVIASGAKALAAVQDKSYDAILMDCQQPGMDGREATRRIRALPGEVSRIPIIALTAHAFASDRLSYLRAGMDDYLAKPVTLEMVRTSLMRALAPPEPVAR